MRKVGVTARALWASPRGREGIGLAAIVVLSALPYLFQLGFYSDDWTFISAFRDFSPDTDWSDPRFRIVLLFLIRPLHGAYSVLLYEMFGLNPVWYHLTNTLVLICSMIAFWRLLRAFALTRTWAFPIAALYCLLPQLSTAKVWYAAYCVTLSQLFFLIGANATLRWIDRGTWRWKALALACWLASILTYELFIPLIAAMAAYAVWRRAWSQPGGLAARLRIALPELWDFGLVLLGLAAKAVITTRTEGAGPMQIVRTFIGRWYVPIEHHGLNAKYAIIVNFWEAVTKPARAVVQVFGEPDAVARIACALMVAAVVFALSRQRWADRPRQGLLLIAAGFVLFWLGYAIFLLTLQMGLSAAGVANRTSVAAAFGVAIVAVGVVVGLSRLLPPALRGNAAAILFALMSFALTLRSSQVDHHWVEASRQQQAFLARAKTDLAALPPGSTLIVEGLCRYAGPAIVLETWWDAPGAIKIATGKDALADVLNPEMTLVPEGVHGSIYGMESLYRYGPTLFVYQSRARNLVRIPDRATAEAVLGPALAAPVCPRGYPAHGVPD